MQAAVQERQVGLPGRYELKKMIRRGLWAEIGALFDFTPVFLEGTKGMIDWKCVPRRCYEILQGSKEGETPVMPGDKLWVGSKVEGRRSKVRPAKTVTVVKEVLRVEGPVGHRERLYCAQNGECHYCGRHTRFVSWTIDHRQPLGRGGANGWENKVGCCVDCNSAKGPLTEAEFLATDYMGGHLELKAEVSRVHEALRGGSREGR